MLNNQERSNRIQSGSETVKKKVIKMLSESELTRDELITVVAQMASNEYAEAKAENFRFSVDSEIEIVKRIINNI